jgi:maltodextrin utilization protein YvdJ
MRIESINNEIKLTFSKKALDITEIQNFIDYVKFREINALSKATQEDANKLAEEINQAWWNKNKHKFE